MATGPDFSDAFRDEFGQLMEWRRDVRRFKTDPVEGALVDRCLATFNLAPSVGLSEPWRIVRVETDAAQTKVLKNFEAANDFALSGYSGERAQTYAGLKLTGMREAPVQLAIFCDDGTDKGSGLGAGTMPEMRRYSVVTAVTQFWLYARTYGLGVGWVSILNPKQLCRDLDVPESWSLVAYLCVGWPEDDKSTPELERAGWEARAKSLDITSR